MERLRALRQERNISQQKLADIIGVTQQAVYKYEHGLAQPDFNTLIHLSEFFHVSVDYLIENPEFDRTITYSARGDGDKDTIIDIDITPTEYHYLSLYRHIAPETRQHLIHIMEAIVNKDVTEE